jgi:hypothetical protein
VFAEPESPACDARWNRWRGEFSSLISPFVGPELPNVFDRLFHRHKISSHFPHIVNITITWLGLLDGQLHIPANGNLCLAMEKSRKYARIKSLACRGVAQPGSAPALGARHSTPTAPSVTSNY